MNIEKLIEAAKRIEKIREKQKIRTREWQNLAKDVKDKTISHEEIENRKRKLNSAEVFDYGDAIEELIEALKENK